MEDDQTGLPRLPPWAAALTAQLQMVVADQLAAQDKTHQAELQELVAESRASAHDALMAKAQWQDQREEIEALQGRIG